MYVQNGDAEMAKWRFYNKNHTEEILWLYIWLN